MLLCFRYYAFTMSGYVVPTWTRPQRGQGGRVKYMHAAAEASYGRGWSSALWFVMWRPTCYVDEQNYRADDKRSTGS